jgi:hypothetical protein
MDESVKRYGVGAVAILIVVFAAYGVWSAVGKDEVADRTNKVSYICSVTEKVYQIELKPDMPGDPQENPDTGERTLWPAEMCYWNECRDRGGTPVLMNTYRGDEEPTHCPVCGRIVRFRNPVPPGVRP